MTVADAAPAQVNGERSGYLPDFCAPRAVLPKPEQGVYYWADLVGLEVVNTQGLVLGVVKGMFSSGAQDVVELQGAKRTQLLPWVSAVVKRVDLEAGRIEVDWGADW